MRQDEGRFPGKQDAIDGVTGRGAISAEGEML
jgi:hypothetical protein